MLDTGTRKIVYLARPNGVFEAREVQVGAPTEDLFPVRADLRSATKLCSAATSSSTRRRILVPACLASTADRKNSPEPASAARFRLSANATTETSAAKLDLHADTDPMKAGEDTAFHVNLTDANGKPIADARVTVTLVMPAMPSMGMPEMKSSFELPWNAGKQMYMGKGQAPMAGSWNVLVEARKNGSVIATFRTHLNAK